MARPSMLVKVGENEFKALLNRDETIADVKALTVTALEDAEIVMVDAA